MLRFGGLNRGLPAEEITLAEVLRAAGFATAIIGKWHLGDQSPSLPTDMGWFSVGLRANPSTAGT
jgi:arylsulfatase A-like enzyme